MRLATSMPPSVCGLRPSGRAQYGEVWEFSRGCVKWTMARHGAGSRPIAQSKSDSAQKHAAERGRGVPQSDAIGVGVKTPAEVEEAEP